LIIQQNPEDFGRPKSNDFGRPKPCGISKKTQIPGAPTDRAFELYHMDYPTKNIGDIQELVEFK